jgi:hypothetical protein
MRTTIEVFAPWTEGDKLSPGIKVTGHLADGSCWTSSIADSADNGAWRCMSANGIYDPCFAPTNETDVTEVACAESPSSGVEMLGLTKPLASGARGTERLERACRGSCNLPTVTAAG